MLGAERALELAERFGVIETAVHALTNLGTTELFLGHDESGPGDARGGAAARHRGGAR